MLKINCPCGGVSVTSSPDNIVRIAHQAPGGGSVQCAKCRRILQCVQGVIRFAGPPSKYTVN